MARAAKEIFDRLGPEGLTRAIEDLLDHNRLVRLANTCGLKYRGMRTKSQSRERLVRDLVAKVGKQEDVGQAVLRALAKESATAAREWDGMPSEQKVRRLFDEDYLRGNGRLGLHLYLLASTDSAAELDALGRRLAHEHLLRVAPNGSTDGSATRPARDEARLRRQVQERERKLRHLEAQVLKAKESHKTAKADLIQRKGELAESRMLVERLRGELTQARSAAEAASGKAQASAAADKPTAALNKAVRQLVSEQKKLVHALTLKIDESDARSRGKRRGETAGAAQRALAETLARLEARDAAESKSRAQQFETMAARLDAIRADLRARPVSAAAKAPKRSRARGAAQRVGVFIDVQNMYYSARRLKGKLDFDALLQAGVQERRLVKATAYVVESKETDQSQFIARLEKRGIEVRRKTLQVRADGSMKGDWDMELALDILDAAPRLDVVVLVSGDGDFTSLVKRVKGMGPRVEVIAFPRTTAKALLQAADSYQPLDRKFMIYSRSSKRVVPPGPAKGDVARSSPKRDVAPDPVTRDGGDGAAAEARSRKSRETPESP